MSGTAYERGTLARMDEVNYLYHGAFGGIFALASGLLASRSVSGVLHTYRFAQHAIGVRQASRGEWAEVGL